MPVPKFPVTINVEELGIDDATSVEVSVSVNTDDGTVDYPTENYTFSSGAVRQLDGGTGSFELPIRTGANPAEFEFRIDVMVYRSGRPSLTTRFAPRYLPAPTATTAVAFASLAGTSSVPASWMTSATLALQAKVDEGAAEADRAEAAAAAASLIALGDVNATVRAATADLLENEREVADAKYALINGAPLEQSPGKNLFNKNTAVADYYWSGGNNAAALAGYKASTKIPVTEGATYTVSKARQIQLFDATGTRIPGSWYFNSTLANYTVTIPAGGAFIGVSSENANIDTLQIELGSEATAYEPYGVKVQRLLAGGELLETAIAGLRTASGGAKSGGGVTVYRTGGEMVVRSAFDSTRDIIMPVELSGGTAPAVRLVISGYGAPKLIAASSPHQSLYPTRTVSATTIHDSGDDNAPVKIEDRYVGGNHGWPTASTVTLNGHGKTSADRGSTWTDGPRSFTLLQVIDANRLLFAHHYTKTGDVVTPLTVAPQSTLTHVAGATNTASISIAGGVLSTQLFPSVHSRVTTVRLDGAPVADGVSAGQALTVTESATIVSYKALVDYARSHIGTDALAADMSTWTAAARLSTTYRFTAAQVIVSQTLRMLDEGGSVSMGVTQAHPLTLPAGGSRVQYMPGVGTIAGVNFSTFGDLASMTALAAVSVADQLATADPASRMVQWALSSTGVRQYGLAMGVLPVMDGKPATRRTQGTDTRSWFISNDIKKNYPQIAWQKPLAPGESLSGVAYRRYLPPTAPPELVVSDGARFWVAVDDPSANAVPRVARVPELLGRALDVVGTATVSPDATYVTGEGITYTNAAPGYVLAEAVVDTSV